ncbi:MAG TPA: hypothetical protein VE714_03280 [Gemmatimonadales bacterium]|nr:hypothetical protein [Gemmatimonadales bacterium]
MPAAALPRAVTAQDTTRATPHLPDSVRRVVPCRGQRIDDIVIHASAPTIAIFRRVPVVAEIVRSLHVTTHAEVIRRFLLFDRGQPCSELRRAESERILRAQPFLADASLLTYANDSGGVDVEVRTIDEASAVIGGAMKSRSPFVTAVRLGSSNFSGSGTYLAGNWRHDALFRDGYGVRFANYQLFARPYTIAMDLQRDPLGDRWDLETAHPFLTDLQRIAWRARSGASNDLVYFEPVRNERHAVRLQRRYSDAGGIIRIGPPGRLSLFGASLSGENESPAQSSILVTPTGIHPDTSTLLAGRYQPHRIARVNALWGVRDIEFVRVQGFDALTATQDIPVGFQLGTQFGRSLTALGSRDDDIFMAADLYVGAAAQNAALRVQLRGEGRRSNDLNVWDGVLTSGRVAQYLKVPGQTLIASAEWSGGWRMRSPFALTLGEEPGGVRGFGNSTVPGGQRGILRLEDRFFLGRPSGLGDAGLGFFADAGKLWAGGVPFGESTPIRAAVGVSVLGAVPPRSARLWRLDVAFPLNPDGRRLVELRIVSSDRTAFFWREPRDVQHARERTVPTSIFSWP